MLRLRAEDSEDLKVISAHLQDSLVRVGDIALMPRKRRLALSLNRFCWEAPVMQVAGKMAYQRTNAGLHFDDVMHVKAHGIDRSNEEALLYLLTVQYQPLEDCCGIVHLEFAGNAALLIEVESVNAQLADIDTPWLTDVQPEHADIELPEGLE